MTVSNFATLYIVSIIETMKTSAYSIPYDKLRDWLKQRREEKGLSLRAVATLLGRHHSVIGKMEQNRRKIEICEFVEYCQVLDIDPHEGLAILMSAMNGNEASGQ